MTDNEIKKALERCGIEHNCSKCPYHSNGGCGCINRIIKDSLDLINRQQAEIDRLESVLLGVMHFVDKWLDDEELNQDEVNRASAMREKTLQIVENQQAEIERLNGCVKSEDEVRAIMKAQMEPMVKEITNEQIDIANKLGRISGILELKNKIEENASYSVAEQNGHELYETKHYSINAIKFDNLVKEMVGD